MLISSLSLRFSPDPDNTNFSLFELFSKAMTLLDDYCLFPHFELDSSGAIHLNDSRVSSIFIFSYFGRKNGHLIRLNSSRCCSESSSSYCFWSYEFSNIQIIHERYVQQLSFISVEYLSTTSINFILRLSEIILWI